MQPVSPQTRQRVELPAIVRHYRFKPAYTLVWAPYIAAYQIVNRFPVFEPRTLEFTAVDRAIPFIPLLLLLYVCYLPYYFWTVARLENDREVNRIFYGAHLQLVVSLVVFILFPVTMPRELFYQTEVYNWADAFWRWFDAPNNCLPSLHASNCLLLMQFNSKRPHRLFGVGMGAAIIASALFVKQHYAVDLLAGAAVYFLARWFLSRLWLTGLDASGWLITRRREATSTQPVHS